MGISLLAKITNLVGVGKKLLFDNKSKIGDLIIDGTHLETISYSNNITTHPIESGSFVSDHIYINPLKVVMDCSITDSSANLIGAVKEVVDIFNGNILTNLSNRFQGKGAKQTAAYEFLKDLALSKSTVTIVNKLDVLPNMAIESLSIPRNNEVGDRLYFSITLQQLSYATVSKTTSLNKTYNLGGIANKLNLGKQTNRIATPQETEKGGSTLNKWIFG